MAVKKKQKFFEKLILGTEKSEGYARASLPSNRWELFWDVLKGNFGKIFLLNIIILITFIPLIFLFLYKNVSITGYGTIYPFNQPFGIGYLAPSSFVGYEEIISLNLSKTLYLFMPIAMFFASIGISGGIYVFRKLVWNDGVFVINDFFKGVKVNFLQELILSFIFSVFFYIFTISIDLANTYIVYNSNIKWIFYIEKYVSIFLDVLLIFMYLHMIFMSNNYKMKILNLIKNSFLFTIALIPHTIVFTLIGILPMGLLYLGSILSVIGILIYIVLGFSWFFLIWSVFTQWAYDKFINPRIPGVKRNKGIYDKVKSDNAEALKKYREQVALTERSSYSMRPIKPITDDEVKLEELPTSFNRNDIIKLQESKNAMYRDNEKYIAEHQNDEKYQISEADIKREKIKRENDKEIEKVRKELSKRKKL